MSFACPAKPGTNSQSHLRALQGDQIGTEIEKPEAYRSVIHRIVSRSGTQVTHYIAYTLHKHWQDPPLRHQWTPNLLQQINWKRQEFYIHQKNDGGNVQPAIILNFDDTAVRVSMCIEIVPV